MFANFLLQTDARPSHFPELGRAALRYTLGENHLGRPAAIATSDAVLMQQVVNSDGTVFINAFNTGAVAVGRLLPQSTSERKSQDGKVSGQFVMLDPFQSLLTRLPPRSSDSAGQQ